MKLYISITVAALLHILVVSNGVSADGPAPLRGLTRNGGSEDDESGSEDDKSGSDDNDHTEKEKKKSRKKRKKSEESDCSDDHDSDRSNGCLTIEAVNGLMQAFEGAVIAISNAYWCRGDHKDEKDCGGPVEDGPPPKAACQRAYEIAHGAIDGAYGYADSVLFKPTLTTEPYTYRPSRNGALSYFIGTVCVNMVGLHSEQFPDGNGDGKMFQENGFALNAFKGSSDGIQRTGWKDLEYDLDKFLYRIDPKGGQNCQTAVVQGKMCFVHHTEELGLTCVDKTFGFNDLTGKGTSPVITTHHSSAIIKEESSLVICQKNHGGTGMVPECS